MAPATSGGKPGTRTGTKFLHASAEKCDGIFFFPDDALAAFENAGAGSVAEDFFGIRTRKRVARDFFAAFDAFEQEGIARALSDAKVCAHRGQKICGKNVVDRDQVALLGEALKFFEVGLNHRWLFCLEAFGCDFPPMRNARLRFAAPSRLRGA